MRDRKIAFSLLLFKRIMRTSVVCLSIYPQMIEYIEIQTTEVRIILLGNKSENAFFRYRIHSLV